MSLHPHVSYHPLALPPVLPLHRTHLRARRCILRSIRPERIPRFDGPFLNISCFPRHPSLAVEIILRQLANLYLLFAINEALVLRATNDITVWKAVLIGLLIADLGHLWSVGGKGWDVYWNVASWNAIDAGNVGFVYAGAGMRIAFLWGVGFGGSRKMKGKKTR